MEISILMENKQLSLGGGYAKMRGVKEGVEPFAVFASRRL
jgi:hypothetical protein